MTIWLTTDTHFGHHKMIEYCYRPENFEEIIKKNLVKMIKKDDVLIHLGDVCIGNNIAHNNWFKTLGCKLWLVRGNHDHKTVTWYIDNGWDMVCDRLDLNVFGEHIALTHKPIEMKEGVNIHGHFHNKSNETIKRVWEEHHQGKDLSFLSERNHLLAIENTNYMPVKLEEFI